MRYETDNVYCNGERCQFHYVTPEEYCDPADLLIITVKFSGLKNAIQAVRISRWKKYYYFIRPKWNHK